jgi:hypothetical protein
MPNNTPGNLTKKRGWSNSNKITIPANQLSNDKLTLAADFAAIEAEGYYTIQFSILPISISSTGFVPRARAEIIWSVEGNSVRREIDVIAGSAISGTGQAVNVRIRDNSLTDNAQLNPSSYLASVQVTPGCRPTWGGSTPPIRLADLDQNDAIVSGNEFTVAAGTSVIRNIPKDAGVNTVYCQARSTTVPILEFAQIFLFQKAFGHTIISMIDVFNASGKWMPIFPGATNITIFNNEAFGVEVTLLFGVEG